MASQLASELGRLATTSALPPSAAHSAAIFFSPSALFAAMTTLAPAAAKVFAAIAPNAPVAPVTIALLPRTSNSDSRIFQEIFGHDDSDLPVTDARGQASRAHDLTLHFTGATATAMVQTSLPRLTISRLSFGPM